MIQIPARWNLAATISGMLIRLGMMILMSKQKFTLCLQLDLNLISYMK